MAAENVDKALEILFHKYFNINLQEKPENIPTDAELLEMRMDEKAVLESIYDTNFRCKDNNLWIIKLNLDYITKMYENKEVPKKKQNINYTSNFKTKKKEVCKLFLKGPCRFGAKCKFLHENNVEKNVQSEPDNIDTNKIPFELEIRFPEGTVYPYQPPILFFKTEIPAKAIPELTCLRVTARLLDEAKILAQDGVPSIYSLVELLNNEEEIKNCIQFDTRTFPEAVDVLFPQLVEETSKANKPTHYKKGQLRDRSNVNFDDILKENIEIVEKSLDNRNNNKFGKMISSRRKLPAWQKKTQILNAIKKSQVNSLKHLFFSFLKHGRSLLSLKILI